MLQGSPLGDDWQLEHRGPRRLRPHRSTGGNIEEVLRDNLIGQSICSYVYAHKIDRPYITSTSAVLAGQ